VLPVDKGPGVTSFQVVAQLRRVLRVRKMGHGGTLDPAATGVLPVLVGEATKLTPYLTELDKEYVATVRLGVVTDTQDSSGRVLATAPVPPLEREAVEGVLARFRGEIQQVPPMYSALHHEGRRLYELAREGREVARPPRPVTIHALTLESLTLPTLMLRVRCGKGTYVRTLAADLGEALGCGAALAGLVRTRVGPYTLDRCVPWEEVVGGGDAARLWARLLPSDSAVAHLAAVTLDAARARAFLNGQTVPAETPAGGLVRVYGPGPSFLGVGADRRGAVKPERILHADPARPRVLPA
jgi:tRNA pseudouridine55 synthase